MLIGLVGVERRTAVGPATVTCTVAKAGGQLDPASASPINFSVVFASAVSGFDGLAINFAGSTAGGGLLATISGSGTTYNVAVTGMTTSGDVAITVVAGYTTPPNALSTSADNTVAWLGAGGGWQTLYTRTLTTDSDGWGSYTMREVIQPLAYSSGAPATASAVRVTINASGTSDFNADHVRIGHGAVTGDDHDYDGTQIPLLFSGSAACFIGAGGLLLSDSANYSFDKTRRLVISGHFPPGLAGIKINDFALEEFIGNYKDTGTFDDTITSDVSGYAAPIPGRLYAFSKVEVFTAGGPTLQALSAGRYAETDIFGANNAVILAATQALTATGYAGDDTFAGHTISTTGTTQTLTAARYTGDDAFATHTVSPGVVGLSATRYTGDDSFGANTITVAPIQNLTASRYTGDDSFPTNTVVPGGVTLSAARYTGDDAFATHTISAAAGAWYDLYSVTLTADNTGWAEYSMRQYIAPAAYGAAVPATGTKVRVTMRAANGAAAVFDHAYVGHTATSGDLIDWDGTQVELLFSTATGGTVAAGGTLTSDDRTYSFVKTKGLVLGVHFPVGVSADIRATTPLTNFTGAWTFDTTPATIVMASNVNVNGSGDTTGSGNFDSASRLYFFAKVEVFG